MALCTATLSGATASCSAGFSSSGTYTVTAAYSGDGYYLGSASSGVTDFILSNPGASIPSNLNIGTVNIGSAGSTAAVTVTFDTAETLGAIAVLTQGIAGLDFTNAGGGTCAIGTAYAAHATCKLNIAFKPSYAGTRYGAVVLSDKKGNPIGTGYLQGTGVAPQSVFVPGTRTSIGSNLVSAQSVAVDAAGNLYLAAWNWNPGDEVVKETPQPGGTYIQTQALIAGGSTPSAVALDGSGNLYVIRGAVFKETPLPDGSYSQAVIGLGYSCPVNVTVNPGIAVDGSGNVYLTDQCNHAVHKLALESNGGYTDTTIGTGWSAPNSIAVDGSGSVYVSDAGTGAVYKDALTSGQYVQSTVGSSFGNPAGVAVDGVGNVYVVDGKAGIVYKETLSNGAYSQAAIASGLAGLAGITVGGLRTIPAAFISWTSRTRLC
jgi:sugar lactone lactonase YvrE